MIYFDTSYIVKCYLNETGSTEVRALAQAAPGLCSCLHGRAEFWTAVKRNVREKLITAAEAAATFERFEQDEAAGVWHWFPIEHSLIEMTCLRAADALHLACAEVQGFTEIYSHDKHVFAAASVFGLIGKDVIPLPR